MTLILDPLQHLFRMAAWRIRRNRFGVLIRALMLVVALPLAVLSLSR